MAVDANQQAMWDALLILGIDGDGDATPAALISGMGEDGFRAMFLRDVQQAREDHDAATDEVCMDPGAHHG